MKNVLNTPMGRLYEFSKAGNSDRPSEKTDILIKANEIRRIYLDAFTDPIRKTGFIKVNDEVYVHWDHQEKKVWLEGWEAPCYHWTEDSDPIESVQRTSERIMSLVKMYYQCTRKRR